MSMKKIQKNIVWFLAFAMIWPQIQACDLNTSDVIKTTFEATNPEVQKQLLEGFQGYKPQSETWAQTAWNYGDYFLGYRFMQTLPGQISLLCIGAYIYMYVQQNTKDMIGNQAMQIYYPGDITTKLDDVAGLAGAKADMQDIISCLQNPVKYQKIGARIPSGVLMNGGPGNGKTLLAKAVAGEVNCPFISVAGASFIQMYVGLGAARVRDLFALAEQLSAEYGACIIFIDEIDAVGQKRSSGSGMDREHDQTVAQLLECMDGIAKQQNPIIVLAATNRAELLDPALTRPGRFDRKVEVTKPLKKDRITLIKNALESVKYSKNIDVERLARITSGFSGAQLATLINDAAVLAVSDNRKVIGVQDIELAFDHIVLGREIQGMERTDTEKWVTAVHEAGHAAAWLFGNNPKYIVHKASITPRSHTLGVVWATPLRESYEMTESEMKARIVVSMCGGLAEQAFGFGKSTGLSSDLATARSIAYDMVVKYGMSEKLNYLSYDEIDDRLPNDIATEVHKEVQKIIDECFAVAKNLVASRKNEIEQIARLLMQKGTVLGDDIYKLVGLQVPAAA